jgi:hypothetical protein
MAFQKNPRVDADVELLLGRYRDLCPNGQLITHDELEAALTLTRKQSRYRTVTAKWRRLLVNEKRVFLDGRSANGHGFVSLTPEEMIRCANKRIRHIGRELRKAIKLAGLPHPTEIADSEMRNYQARLFVACDQLTRSHKAVLLDLTRALQPPRQLPRTGTGA